MGIGMILIVLSVLWAFRNGKEAGNDPWGARTLEWATTSPPPHYNFDEQPVAFDRDAFWAMKYPDSEHGEAGTSKRPAFEENGFHLPGQSWYPFVMTVAMFIGSYALMYKNWVLGIFMFLVIMAGTYGWAFEGVGGHHVHPEHEDDDHGGVDAAPSPAIGD